MIQLASSPVVFSENPHGYFLDSIRLSGITTLIKAATGLGEYPEASDYVKEFLIHQTVWNHYTHQGRYRPW